MWIKNTNNYMEYQQFDVQMAQQDQGVNRYNLVDMPLPDSKDQVAMWQQNFMDSGIHSMAPSKPASISGKEMDGTGEWMDNQQSDYTPEQVELNQHMSQSRCHRPRGAVYPETVDDRMEIHSPQYDPSLQSTGHRLHSESSQQMLKNQIVNLIKVQDNSVLASKAVPELIKLITDEDQFIVSQTALIILKMSKNDASRHAIVNNPQMVEALIKALDETNDVDTTKVITSALHFLSQEKQGLLAIHQKGGIKALVKLLNSPVESILNFVVTTIHNLLLHQEGTKAEVKKHGGLQKMVALLHKDNIKFLSILTDCIRAMAFQDSDSKLTILQCHGPQEIIRILKTSTYDSPETRDRLLISTCRVLKVLSVCRSNKLVIVENGGFQALIPLLTHSNQRLVENCLLTIRNLSDAAIKVENIDNLLHLLVQFLKCDTPTFVTCAAGILGNLTCYNQHNKRVVCQCNGIESLLLVIYNNAANEAVTEPVVMALRNLTSGHADAEQAQSLFGRTLIDRKTGIHLIYSLAQSPARWPLIKAVIGLIRNLSIVHMNQQILKEIGAVAMLVKFFSKALREVNMRVRTPDIAGGPSYPTIIDNVNMEDIIEASVGSLHILARDPHIRQIIRSYNTIPDFVRLLCSNIENIQRVAAGTLLELSNDPDAIDEIISQDPETALKNLITSTNEGVFSYAHALLNRVSAAAEKTPTPTMWPNEMEEYHKPPMQEFKQHSMQEFKPPVQEYKHSIPDFSLNDGINSYGSVYNSPPTVQGHSANFSGLYDHNLNIVPDLTDNFCNFYPG